MAHDTLSSEELMGLVDYTKTLPFFMLEQYFTRTFVSHADKVSFDEVFEDVLIAPFVSPVADGDSVVHGGYKERDFQPAYIKLDDPITIAQVSAREPGQPLNTPPNRLSQLQMAIVKRLAQHRKSILTRLEWMAWQYALTGGYTVSGPKYPTKVLDFGRAAGNTVVLAGADQWTNPATATPLDDAEEWSKQMLGAERGLAGTHWFMRTEQWNNLRKCAQFLEEYARYKSNGGPIPNISPTTAGWVINRGSYGAFNIWTVDTWYKDENGAQQYFLPTNKVIMAAAPGVNDCVKMFGKIESLKAVREGDPMIDIWHNHYVTEDGDSENIKTHSAPLVAATHVDGFLSATVSA